MKNWKTSSRFMGIFLAACAVVGLVASFTLLHETIAVAKNPSYTPSCDINPLVSCSSVMSKPESEILGLPFATFGVAGFTALLTFAVLLYAGTKFATWVWQAGIAAALAGVGAVIYMFSLSLFSYGSICPWCFVTWVTVIAIFWAIVTHVFAAKHLKIPSKLKAFAAFWVKNAPMILAVLYVTLIFIIVLRFNEALLG